MNTCRLCGRSSKVVSNVIGVCYDCLKSFGSKAVEIAMEAHERYRTSLGLPPRPPTSDEGIGCSLCVNECRVPPNGKGFCGYWVNRDGRLEPIVGHGKAVVFWYLDPLPTNCVATPVCPAATSKGYPKYTPTLGPEYGYYNLAVFFCGCSLDCLFCQNWDHKDIIVNPRLRKKYVRTVDDLYNVAVSNDKITCVCYFGGDPGPQIPYAIAASRRIIEYAKKEGKIKRICWETNGVENPNIMKVMANLSLESGGIVKIDWKAWTPEVYQALTGINGYKAVERVKKNVEVVASLWDERPEIPLIVVSTLLVPGYVTVEEVGRIAEYLASINNEIPYILLAFHPDHLLRDLPPTSTNHAYKAYEAALSAGLKYVFIGNEWLLGDYY